MLFTITLTGENTSDLGYLLYKNPYRPQTVELSHGKAHVFYPEVSREKTTAALLLEINPIDLARGKIGSTGGGLFDYVNDRPYVSSSFLSTAIAKVYGTALTGRADKHQALADQALDLTATITMLPVKNDAAMLGRVFEPLGYSIEVESFALDEKFLLWGEGGHVNLTIRGHVRLRDLLKHIYVLIPVFDRQKHYWFGPDEVEKLLRMGEEWLPAHPERIYIARRYLARKRQLANMALERLVAADTESGRIDQEDEAPKEASEKRLTLNAQRLGSVVAALKNAGAHSVIDIGCGEGNLLDVLIRERQFKRITGVDVSYSALEKASSRLKLADASDGLRERVTLLQGSLTYRDHRFEGYDAACVIEVIEHLDIARLRAFERVLFECAKPPVVILTTPNKEYNVHYATLEKDRLRHTDHRFEWTRAEFRGWAERIASENGYTVQFSEIGDADTAHGAPTQMGVFSL